MTGQASKLALTEKPPPKWGVLCEYSITSTVAVVRVAVGRKTPTEVGRCLRVRWPPRALPCCTMPSEKLPPKWGVLCEV